MLYACIIFSRFRETILHTLTRKNKIEHDSSQVLFKSIDEGSNDRPYGHALIAGIDRYPRKVTRRMGKKKVSQRTKIKPFVKLSNFNHLMPTRFLFAAYFLSSPCQSSSRPQPGKVTRCQRTKLKPFVEYLITIHQGMWSLNLGEMTPTRFEI